MTMMICGVTRGGRREMADVLVQLLLLLLQLVTVAGSTIGQGVFVEVPLSVMVMPGEDVLLRCVVNQQFSSVQWAKDGFVLGFDREVAGYPRYQYQGDGEQGEHHLTIKEVTLQDDGEYQCQVAPTLTTPAVWASANLTVMVAPFSIRMSVVGAEGVRERSGGGGGGGGTGQQRKTKSREEKRRGGRVVGNLVLYTEAGGSPYAAEGGGSPESYIAEGNPYTKGETETKSNPYTNIGGGEDGVVGSVVEVRAGQRLGLQCVVTRARPPARVAWYRGGFRISQGSHREEVWSSEVPEDEEQESVGSSLEWWDVRSQLVMVVTVADNTQQYSCRALHPAALHHHSSPTSTLVASLTLNVLQDPGAPLITGYRTGEALKEGERRVLTCLVVGGNPRPRVTWYRHGRPINPSSSSSIPQPQALNHQMLQPQALEPYSSTFPSSSSSSSSFSSSTSSIPQPPTTRWNEDGGVRVEQEVRACREEDRAVYECRVTSPLLISPLTTNVTLSIHYAPTDVMVTGPSVVVAGDLLILTCTSTPANPPPSLIWTLQDVRVSDDVRQVVSQDVVGGWVVTSRLSHLLPGSLPAEEAMAKCSALHLATTPTPTTAVHTFSIVRRPGSPVLVVEDSDGVVLEEMVVLAGVTLRFSCGSDGGSPLPIVTLDKNGEALKTRVMTGSNGVTKVWTKMVVVSSDNGAQVRCNVTSPATPILPPLTATITLQVSFPAEDVRAWAVPERVKEGQSATLLCQTSSSRPPSEITWHSTSPTALQGIIATVTHIQAQYGGVSTRSEVVVRAWCGDFGSVFSCHAHNDDLGPTLTANVTLDIIYGPVWVEAPLREVEVKEGEDLVMVVKAQANPSPVRYSWWRGPGRVEGVDSERSREQGRLHLQALHRQDAGGYSVTAYNNYTALHASFSINVLYKPEGVVAPERMTADENREATVVCTAVGNPTPYLVWTRDVTHFNSSSEEAVEVGVGEEGLQQQQWVGMGEARLVIKRTVRKDAGFYHCHAHNKVGSATPVTTALVVTQEPTLPKSDADERGGGGGQWWARVGDKASLRCHVVAAPAPSFRWTVNTNRVILNSHKFFVRSPQLVDGLMEWESVLELRSVVEADFTEYTCTATNTKGTLTTNHTLIPPHPPHTPRHLQVSAVTGASVTLSWSSHNITDLLGYTLKYSPVADPEYKEMEVKGGDRLSVVVGDLKAGVEYYFTLQAHSTQGSSPFTSPPVFLTIPEAEGLASSSRSSSSSIEVVGKGQLQRLPRFVVLLLSLTTAAFLFLNITIAAFCVRRYTTRRRTQGSGNKTAVVVVMGQQNNAIKDNDGGGGEGDISGDIQTSTTSAHIQTVDVTRINREAEKSKSTPETTKARDKPQQHQHLSTFISYKEVEGKLDSQKLSSSQQSIDNLSIKSTQSHLIGSYSNTPPLTPSDRHHHHTSLSDLKELAQNSIPLPPPPPSDKHHTYPNHHYQHHLHHTSLSDFKELTPSHSYLSLTLPWDHRGFNKDDALLSRSASPMSDLEINKSNKVMMSQCSCQPRGHYYLLGKSPLTTKCPSSEAKREANLLQEGCHSTKDHQSNKDYQHPHKSNGNREEEHPGRKNYPSKNGKHLYQQEKRGRGSEDYQSGGSCVVVLDEVPSEEDTSHSSCDSCSHHVGSRRVKVVDPKNTSNIPDVCLKGPLHCKSILWQQQQQQPDKLLEEAAIISDQQLLAPSLSQPLVEAQVSTQQSQMMLVGPSEFYSHQTPRHCSDSSQYSPSSPQYHSSSPKYRPNSPHYRPKLPKYRPNSPQYCQTSPQFQPDSPHYHPNSPKYRPESLQYLPESPQYCPESPQYCPESPHFLNVIDLMTKSFSSGKPTSQVIYHGHPHLQQQLEKKQQQTEGQLTQQQDQDDLQDSLSYSPTQQQQLQQEEDGSTLQVDHHRLFSHRDLPHLSYKHSLTSIHEEPGEQQQPQQQSNTINQQHTHHNLLQQQHHQPASYPPHHPIPTPHQHYHHRKYYPPPETHPRSEIHQLPYLKNQQQYLNGINSLLENHTLSKTPQDHFPDSHDHHLPENQEMLKVQQHSSSITHQQQLSKGHQQHLSKLHEDHQPKTHQHPPDNHYQHLPESNQQNRERDFKYVSTTNITPYPSAALQCCKPGGLRLYHPSVIIYPSSHPGYCPLCAVASAALCYEERCRYGVTQNI